MADYKVRAVWDVGNAAQFEQSVKATVNSSTASLRSATAVTSSPATETQNILSKSEALIRSYYTNVKPAFSGLASTISDPAVNSSLTRSLGLLDQQISRVRTLRSEFLEAQKAYLNPEKLSPSTSYGSSVANVSAAQNTLNTLPIQQAVRRELLPQVLSQQQQDLENATLFLKGGARNPQTQAFGLTSLGGGYYAPQTNLDAIAKTKSQIEDQDVVGKNEIAQAQTNVDKLIAIRDAELVKLKTTYAQKNADLRTASAQYVEIQRAANAQLEAAIPAPQQVTNPDLQRILQTSPQALSKLQGQGFGVSALGARPGVGTDDFTQVLSSQGAEITKITRDAETGVTSLGLKFRNLDENARLSASGLQVANLAIKDNGTLVEQTSEKTGNAASSVKKAADEYSGLGRAIQRTVEYAAIAAVAYGAFNAAIGQIKNINELNAGLVRLGITSRLSAADTKQLFNSLSTVAYQTATPLNELVKSADDIALAVRRAGQSSESYKEDIVSLTQAVGIFTNLSGVDTVTATDQLSSAFKQLGIAPQDLLGVLDKITAVAGGQSTAIADITAGLGSVAAAAKTAGLNTDEMISSLQVLGQVTNKSPEELAVAFKALFGALDSPGSIKTLKSFGIEVKDAAGGIRPFLVVYQEIADAIAKGVIPQNQIETVTRAIAGGPRRAPDAAAFLENISKVSSTTAISVGATNEALVANAAIVQTNQAKLTQLQVALESTVYKAFGETVNNIVGALLSFGLTVTNIISALGPLAPFLTSALITVVGLASTMKLLSGILGLVGKAFGIVATSAEGATVAIEEETVAASKSGTTGISVASRIGKGGVAGLAGIAGAGISLASGGSPIDAIGSGLSAAGIGLLATGDPLGLIPLIGGQILPNLIPNQKKDATDQSTLESQQQLVQNIQTYKAAQQSVSDLNDKQVILGKTIGGLQEIQKPTIVQLNQLIDLQNQYAQGTLDSVAATDALTASFKELNPGASSLSAFALAATGGGGLSADLDAIKRAAVQAIILKTSPDFKEGGRFFGQDSSNITPINFRTNPSFQPTPVLSNVSQTLGLPVASSTDLQYSINGQLLPSTGYNSNVSGPIPAGYQLVNGQLVPTADSLRGQQETRLQQNALNAYNTGFNNLPFLPGNAQQFTQGRQFLPQSGQLSGTNLESGLNINFTRIATGAENVGDVFNKAGDKIVAKFQLSQATIAAVTSGIQLLKDKGDPLAATYEKTWQSAIDQADAYSYTLDTVSKNIAIIQAQQELGFITVDDAKKLTALQNVAAITATISQNAVPTPAPGSDRFLQSLTASPAQQIQKAATALSIDPNGATEQKNFADTVFKNTKSLVGLGSVYDDLLSKGPEALANAESLYISKTVGLTSAIKTETQAELDNAKALAAKKTLQDGLNNAAKSAADRDAALAGRIAGGEFTSRPGYLKNIQSEYASADTDQIRLTKSLNGLPIAKLRELEHEFSKVPGFEDAATLSANDFVAKLITQGVALGLTGKNIDTVTGKVLGMVTALSLIPTNIQVAVDIITSFGAATGQPGLTVGGARSQGGLAGDVANSALNNPTGDFGSAAGTQSAAALAAAQKKADQAAFAKAAKDAVDAATKAFNGSGYNINQKPPSAAGGTKASLNTSLLDLSPDILQSEKQGLSQQPADLKTIIANAKKLQGQIPGETAKDKNDVVEILDGTKRLAEVRGISEELLRKSMDELSAIEKARLAFDTKADTIRRIRVGSGDFAALANVPFNNASGVSVGGPNGPVTVNLNVNGQLLTPAQMATLGNKIGAVIKQSIVNG